MNDIDIDCSFSTYDGTFGIVVLFIIISVCVFTIIMNFYVNPIYFSNSSQLCLCRC